MARFDLETLIARLNQMNYEQMILAAEREARETEALSFKKKGAVQAREQGSTRYLESIKGVLFFLRTGTRPAGISDAEFGLMRPLIKQLGAKGQSRPEGSADDNSH